MKPPDPMRRRAFLNGLAAEVAAESHLAGLGFEPLNRRYKTRYGEIDLVLSRREPGQPDLVIFVEVKARASYVEGISSITLRAQRRIADSALQWIAENADRMSADTDYRFDVAIVTPDGQITILEAAFDAAF